MIAFLKVLLCVLVVALIIPSFMMYICELGGKSKLYCQLYNRDEWDGWEKIVENFNTVEFVVHNEFPSRPDINSYKFSIAVDGEICSMYYWEHDKDVSVHGYPFIKDHSECLCSFDKYHQKVVKGLLCEKFDFMKEVIEKDGEKS